MRELKFRAWDGEEILADVSTWTDDYTDMLNEYFSYWQDESLSDGKLVFMQYTGLKDKHGKEIYEGDILAYTREEQIISIRWDGSGANWQFDEHDNSFDDGVGRGNWGFNFGVAKHCEIIGNIYQNPDLLK